MSSFSTEKSAYWNKPAKTSGSPHRYGKGHWEPGRVSPACGRSDRLPVSRP